MNNCEFAGDIATIRDIEDCIRATKKYTEGVNTIRKHHPVQGEDFPSKKFCKHYEIYPEIEITWNMGAGDAIDLLWGDVLMVELVFDYDYRVDKASVFIKGHQAQLEVLLVGIPELCDLLKPEMATNGYKDAVTSAIKKARSFTRKHHDKPVTPPRLIDKIVDYLTPRGKN